MQYAYSYDREDYTGQFATPQAAFEAAVRNAEGISSPPTTIYIGTVVEADPQATDHAERIIDSMNQRAHVDIGDSAAKYLRNVTAQQVKQLDQAIAATILAWLKQNALLPTFVQIRSVQEYPVAYPGGGDGSQPRKSEGTEVQEIGSDPSGDMAGL